MLLLRPICSFSKRRRLVLRHPEAVAALASRSVGTELGGLFVGGPSLPASGGGVQPAGCALHTSCALAKVRAGRYRVTIDRSRPLTYEMALRPEEIGRKKGFNSLNTAQLEDTFNMKEEMGQDLPHKTFVEDLFIRKFMHGTWPETFESELIIKRQHNLIRVAGIMNRLIEPKKIYFLIGYTEEMLSLWLKCPVKVELQTIPSPEDVVYKYI